MFAEMYGFPLSIYVPAGWLQTRYPGVDLMSHDAGHLWSTVFGLSGNPHFSVLHNLSFFMTGGGFLPVLVVMYLRLAHAEEAEARLKFGDAYVRYDARVPGWLPRPGNPSAQGGPA